MKIIVSVKQVPSRESALRLNPGKTAIDASDLTFEMNEPDAYALEEALSLRDIQGGEVIVISVGSEQAGSTIREALAKGADRAIHVQTGAGDSFDPLVTARLLAKAIEPESPDLILTGLQSDDYGYGETGVMLAELLGISHATIIMQVELDGAGIRVKRELEDGWFQHVSLPLPALLTIQSGIRKLRYATLMGIKKAKTKDVRVVEALSLGVSTEPSITIESIFAPEKNKKIEMLTGRPDEIARQLVQKLRSEARVL